MTINITHHGRYVVRLGDLRFFDKKLRHKDLLSTGIYQRRDITFAIRSGDFAPQH